MASVPPDPRRNVVPGADEPAYDPRPAAPTSMRRNTRRVGIATIVAMLVAALAVAVIVLL